MVGVDLVDYHIRFSIYSVRFRSSILRDNLLISWTTLSKVDLIAPTLLSVLPIIVKRGIAIHHRLL